MAYLETMFHEKAKDTDNINYEEFKTVVRCKQVRYNRYMGACPVQIGVGAEPLGLGIAVRVSH